MSSSSSSPATSSPKSPTSPTTSSSHTSPKSQSEWFDMMMNIVTVQGRYETEIRELAEQVDELTRRNDVLMNQIPKQWIRDNLEEAQQIIDNIVGIKGITEDPLKAAIKMGISQPQSQPQPQPEHSVHYHEYQTQMPRVSISSSIVPSNEELYGY